MGFLELSKEIKIEAKPSFILSNSAPFPKQQCDTPEDNHFFDSLARSLGFVVGVSGELYFATIYTNPGYKTVLIFIEKAEAGWEARRETFVSKKPHAVGIRKICSNTEFSLALKQVKRYLHLIKVLPSH